MLLCKPSNLEQYDYTSNNLKTLYDQSFAVSRSRNVFLRITDGRKYCYYSLYVWSCTIGMTVFAVVAHLTLDTDNSVSFDKKAAENPHGAIGKSCYN